MPEFELVVSPQEYQLVLDENQTLVVVDEIKSEVEISRIGERGPSGPAGTSNLPVSRINAAVDVLLVGTLAYAVTPTTIDRALATVNAKRRVLGMVTGTAINPGASGSVMIYGIVSQSTALWDALLGTSGGLIVGNYFLSNVAGLMSPTPSPTGWVAEVGEALNGTDFLVRIEPTIKL